MTLLPVVQTFLKFLGGKMGIRLVLLLVVGLGALYTIHLLAQDFMKIRKGATMAAKFLLGKRDLDNIDVLANITRQELDFEEKIEWDKVLRRDPFNCALSLVCQLSAGAAKDNEEANRIYEFITHAIEHTKVPKKLRKAYDEGSDFNKNEKADYKKCYRNYPICPYSADTMLKLIQHFTELKSFLFG